MKRKTSIYIIFIKLLFLQADARVRDHQIITKGKSDTGINLFYPMSWQSIFIHDFFKDYCMGSTANLKGLAAI